jgi:hypothetical protein
MKEQSKMSYFQSIVHEALKRWFGNSVLVNQRPDWLRGLELDFLINNKPKRIAIEVDGLQHEQFVPELQKHVNNFYAQVGRDGAKEILCQQHSITLLRVKIRTGALKILRKELIEKAFLRETKVNKSVKDLQSKLDAHCIKMRNYNKKG